MSLINDMDKLQLSLSRSQRLIDRLWSLSPIEAGRSSGGTSLNFGANLVLQEGYFQA